MIRTAQLNIDDNLQFNGKKLLGVAGLTDANGNALVGGGSVLTPATATVLGGLLVPAGGALAIDGTGNLTITLGAGMSIANGALVSSAAQGPQGPQGLIGPQGQPGVQGPAGPPGNGAGTTTTVSATGNLTATLSGSNYALTMNADLTGINKINGKLFTDFVASGDSIAALSVAGLTVTNLIQNGRTLPSPVADENFVNSRGFVTAANLNGYATTSQLASYLPLAGGTITGSLTVTNSVAAGGLTGGSVTCNGIMNVTGGGNVFGSGGYIHGFGDIEGSRFTLSGRTANYFDIDSDGTRTRLNGAGLMIANGFSGLFLYSSGFVGNIWMKNNAYTIVMDQDLQLGNSGTVKKTLYCGSTVTSWSDVAEEVPCPAADLTPGDVAVIDSAFDEAIKKHTGTQYDLLVAGVVSTKPGVVLGSSWSADDTGKATATDSATQSHPADAPAPTAPVSMDAFAPLALTGRVPTKVTTQYEKADGTIVRRPILKGYIIVSSSIPGHAMAADPSDCPTGNVPVGTMIGKAMQDFNPAAGEPTEGSIKVWVNLG